MASDDSRVRPTSRPPRSARLKITIYRTHDGAWQFHETPGSIAVDAEIADGHRVRDGLVGQLSVFGDPTELGMSAEQAVRAGVLILPIVQKR